MKRVGQPPAAADAPATAGRSVSGRRPDVPKRLHAQDGDRIYQAAGDQYIYDSRRPAPGDVRNTLPRDIVLFTGRNEEIDKMISAVDRAEHTGEPMPVHAINGMAGVGKTSLAVHVGYLLAHRFPDGQLFLDLHAHTADQASVTPAAALARLLEARGVPPEDVPAGLDERAALWRARMAGKRVLLIMDDVASHGQVAPLLPGAGGCLVLITSRGRLAGLSARPGAQTLPLDTLPADQAVRLFLRLIDRVLPPAEVRAVEVLVHLCGYLPLAIALLAARLKPEKLWRVSDLVEELAETTFRLSPMYAGDIEVAAAFDLSCRDLPADRHLFFRRLGLHPGTDLDAHAAAALNGTTLGEARRHLDALYDGHLIEQPIHGRFRMHDLVADYTRALLGRDPAEDRERAVVRLLDYYQHTAGIADRLIAPTTDSPTTDSPATGSPAAGSPAAGSPVADSPATGVRAGVPFDVPRLSSPERAMNWFHAEAANLLACAGYARSRGEDARLVGIAAALTAYLLRNGPWEQAIGLHRAAAEAAGRLGDRQARANALHRLGEQLRRTGDYPGADGVLREALALFRDLGWSSREAQVLDELACVLRLTWDLSQAAEALQQGLAIYQQIDDRRGQAGILGSLAMVRWLGEDYAGTVEAAQQALRMFRDLGDRHGQADALFRLSLAYRATHDYPAAIRMSQEVLAIYREFGDRLGIANASRNLGFLRIATEDVRGAAEASLEALGIYAELGDRVGEANTLNQLGTIHRIGGDLPEAVRALQRGLALFQDVGDRVGEAASALSLGVVWRVSGDLTRAADSTQRALRMYRELGSRTGEAEARNQSGAVELERGDVSGARRQYELALDLAIEAHSLLEEARALVGAGQCARRDGDLRGAVRHLRQALAIYEGIGVPEAARTASELDRLEKPPSGA